jgi:hypothetical protein
VQTQAGGKEILYRYNFAFANGKTCTFEVRLDDETSNLITQPRDSYPDWALLKNNQCPQCPLDAATHKYCPVAANMVDLVEYFRDFNSIDRVVLTIEAKTRKYVKEASVENGISSLIGLYMATSGCPIMEKLKPMARFHLPFASTEETRHHAISTYLLAQYIRYKHGQTPDWELKGLGKLYEDIRDINRTFVNRLKDASKLDASSNALVKLDCFAMDISFLIDHNALQKMEKNFKVFLEG